MCETGEKFQLPVDRRVSKDCSLCTQSLRLIHCYLHELRGRRGNTNDSGIQRATPFERAHGTQHRGQRLPADCAESRKRSGAVDKLRARSNGAANFAPPHSGAILNCRRGGNFKRARDARYVPARTLSLARLLNNWGCVEISFCRGIFIAILYVDL